MSGSRITMLSEAAARWAAQRFEDVQVRLPDIEIVQRQAADLGHLAERFRDFFISASDSIFPERRARHRVIATVRTEPHHGGGIDFERYVGGFNPVNNQHTNSGSPYILRLPQMGGMQIIIGAMQMSQAVKMSQPPPPVLPPVCGCFF